MEAIIIFFDQQVDSLQEFPKNPQSIFILRNNDIGDLLIITPLFEALSQLFPNSKIVVGVGKWNLDTIKHNPYISEVIAINAPWFNRIIPNQTLLHILFYIFSSPETLALTEQNFTIGIDIFGSYWGALLLLKAKISYRLGVKGYAGGHRAMQQYVQYNEQEQVGRSALRFAELLGATELPKCRPQIFLSSEEKLEGEFFWTKLSQGQGKRIILAPGSGLEAKCWPLNYYIELVQELTKNPDWKILIVGGNGDIQAGEKIGEFAPNVTNVAGQMTLRQTFALTAASHFVLCNSSMMMHTAAAFSRPTLVLLGETFLSKKQHDAQWGYEELYWSLGKEVGERETIYNASEVFEFIKTLL